ncbi:hypothetical protein QEG98_21800 [Myxococcus sp. MxC21-1]|nr:hypothetical protein [Myxococcus sp. MxC21-1]WNZ58782.1 hypothetical protein QEG98_21800 [Myxococcus sp. MxC21-1]
MATVQTITPESPMRPGWSARAYCWWGLAGSDARRRWRWPRPVSGT